jgi:hypothetical protein
MGPRKIRILFLYFNLFWGHFATKTSLLFGNLYKILNFFIPFKTYFQKKMFTPPRRVA